MTTKQDTKRAEARDFLLTRIQRGDTLWTSVRAVARSGMSRKIQVFVIRDNEPWNVSAYVADALGVQVDRDVLAVKVRGCGMDMGFHLVSSLSRCLFPDDARPDYVLKQRWLS